MADVVSDLLALPWPVVAVALVFVLGFAAVALVSLFVFGVYVITRVPPFAWILRRSLWGMMAPIQTHAEGRVREIVAEELEPIHRQVFPNGGGSLSDKIDEAVRVATVANDQRARLDRQLAIMDSRQSRFDEELRRQRSTSQQHSER